MQRPFKLIPTASFSEAFRLAARPPEHIGLQYPDRR